MIRRPWALPALAALLAAAPAVPQSGSELEALRRELEALKQGQLELKKQIEELKALLQRQPALAPAAPPRPVVPVTRDLDLSVEGAPFKGDSTAKVTLVEFSDYQCGFCARHVRQTLPELERDYVKTGKLRYVFRDFPVPSHAFAFKAHEAAACAGEQGKYWEMHDRLFANQAALQPSALPVHADLIGLAGPAFRRCLEDGRHAARVNQGLADGRAAGVTGTPAYFLGLTAPGKPTIRVASAIRGAKPYAVFKEAIEALLALPASARD